MSEIYNSVSVPHGARSETVFNSDLTELGVYKFENFTITRPATVIERKEVDASAKDWVAVRNYPTMTCTVQIPLTASDWPPQGAFILDTFDGLTEEKWVIVEVAPGLVMGDYHKVNVTLRGDIVFPPSGHWALNTTATDASGNALTLTLAGNAAISSNSLGLDGTGDYATRADNALLDADTGDFTAMLLMKSNTAVAGTDRYLFSKFTGGIGWYIKLELTSGKALGGVANGATVFEVLSTAAVNDNATPYNHIALVKQGSTLKIYVNGNLDDSDTVPVIDLTNAAPLRIGADAAGANAYTGIVQGVRFYKRALSESEIDYYRVSDYVSPPI